MNSRSSFSLVCAFLTSICWCSLAEAREPAVVAPPPPPKISDQLKTVMSEVNAITDLVIPFDTDQLFLLRGSDSVKGQLDWLGFSKIEHLDDLKKANFTLSRFIKTGGDSKISFTPVSDAPQIAWSFNQGGNINTDLGAALGTGTGTLSADSVYEITISKIGEFRVDVNLLDQAAFDSSILQEYVLSVPKDKELDYAAYKAFAPKFGVATSGALYEIVLNEYNSANIDTEVNITGIVKANGKFYKKSSKITKKSIFKIFYFPATTDATAFQLAESNRELLRETTKTRFEALAKKATPDTTEDPGIKGVTGKIKDAFTEGAKANIEN